MNKKYLSLYSLKWDPFSPELPIEALLTTSAIDSYCWRVEHGLARDGGFGLITGEPGVGKSVVLRLLHKHLGALPDVTVGAIEYPQSRVADFYRELGDLFGVEMKPNNRWGGFKALRERWKAHIEATLMRPALLIDEAQEMSPAVLTELRILSSTRFDSCNILAVVLAGDSRLTDKLRQHELLALGSRLRPRLTMEYASVEELRSLLKHLMTTAGNPSLMTPQLIDTLCEHALGNSRVLTQMASELLAVAAQREYAQLDEKLYLEVFATARPPKKASSSSHHRRSQ